MTQIYISNVAVFNMAQGDNIAGRTRRIIRRIVAVDGLRLTRRHTSGFLVSSLVWTS